MIRKLIRKIVSIIFPNSHLIQLVLHQRSARRNSNQSFAGEVDRINKLLGDASISKGFAIDIAASDGLSQSCTLHLYKKGWAGLCVEMDPIKFSKLAFLYREFGSVALEKVRVTPNNVSSVLRSAECPQKFEFLNLDIDSYDLHVLREILENDFKPKLISMEINEKIPSKVFFTVNFDEKHYWQGDHFYDCSLGAAADLMKEFDYSLVELEWNNAFFMPNSLISELTLEPICPHQTYAIKYKNNADRLDVFPWNSDVDYWQKLSSEEAVSEIKKFFSKYKGKFTCEKLL